MGNEKFEGPEKKIEIILKDPLSHLRDNAAGKWDRVVNASQARVISSMKGRSLDAYLLSESSLFVWDDRILMITCGRTNLINALPEILTFLPSERVGLVFYERKNHLFPERQPSDFSMDVANLEQFFPGKSYRLGPANQDHVNVFYSSHDVIDPGNDATLQVLMHDVDTASRGWRHSNGMHESSGKAAMDYLFDDLRTDSHFFKPEGVSINGIGGTVYATVHVTPGQKHSYASFETNTLSRGYDELISHTVAFFSPQRFSVMLTASLTDACSDLPQRVSGAVPGYRISEKSAYIFDCGYTTVFISYHRHPLS
jgi:S-adenosylmethionine decarboxylase